ncbi:UNVERIFIED_CONTAM: hypothetical protein FKN15_016350 [Acipenser sinensis]
MGVVFPSLILYVSVVSLPAIIEAKNTANDVKKETSQPQRAAQRVRWASPDPTTETASSSTPTMSTAAFLNDYQVHSP